MIIRIRGKTKQERLGVTSAASDAVGLVGGYILDYRQFSNLAVVFTVELPARGFRDLREKLAALDVILDPPTDDEVALWSASEAKKIMGSLRLDFLHQEPDLRIPVPAVPG